MILRHIWEIGANMLSKLKCSSASVKTAFQWLWNSGKNEDVQKLDAAWAGLFETKFHIILVLGSDEYMSLQKYFSWP